MAGLIGGNLFSPDVFISYSREDRAHARRFAQALAQEGLRVWWDDAIHSGQTFDTVIEQELRAAKAVVVLWSPRSVNSRWVRSEASIADRIGRLVPAVIEPCDRPIMFELTHTVDLSHWEGDKADPVWRVFMNDLTHLISPEGEIGMDAPTGGAPTTIPEVQSATIAPPAPPSPSLAKPVQPSAADDQDDDEEYEATQFFSQADQDDYLGSDRHCLELYDGDQLAMRIVIGPLGLKIGRAAPADLVVADPLVSRSHCKLEFTEGSLVVKDLNSTNGTFVDGERVQGSAELPPGGSLGIGSAKYVYAVRDRAEVDAPPT